MTARHHRAVAGGTPKRLIAAAAVMLALASPWAAAARGDVAQVTVVSPGGAAQTLALDALAGSEDVAGRAYALRSSDGESARTVSGFSLAAVLAAAGADTYGFSYLEVQRPAGGTVLLGRDQALDDDAFPDGPPVVYASAGGAGFLRPSAGAEDFNAGDSFEAPQGISIVLRKGSRLQVRAKASPLRTRPGRPVLFSAVVEQAGSGERLAYSWYFDDGHSAATPEATHSFAKRGSYDVVLGVTGASDDTGSSAVVTIQVGAPIAGPDRRGGGANEDAGAPDHGTATGPAGETDSGGSGGGAVGRGPADMRPAGASRVRRGTAERPARKAAPSAPAGELVEGELVSARASVPSKQREPAAARRGRLEGDSGGGVPGVAWGLLATLGLLGAGAAAEAGAAGGLRLWRGRSA